MVYGFQVHKTSIGENTWISVPAVLLQPKFIEKVIASTDLFDIFHVRF